MQIPTWFNTSCYIPAIAILLLLLIGLLFIRVGYKLRWTGFGEYKTGRKTLWDWMQLIIIPAALALTAIWFNQSQQQQNEQLAESRLQEDVVQQYFDKMTELMLKEG